MARMSVAWFVAVALMPYAAAQTFVVASPPLVVEPNILTMRIHAVGVNPQNIAAADFDGDGVAELIVPTLINAEVHVLSAYGAGGFERSLVLPAPSQPKNTVVGDWNGDGLVDLGVMGSSEFRTYVGDGQGQLNQAASVPATSNLHVATGDMNGDSTLDLVSCGFTATKKRSVLLGNGTTFNNLADLETGFLLPDSLGLLDINGDGSLDVVVGGITASTSQLVRQFRNDGTGTLTQLQFLVTNGGYDIEVADLNLDGATDVALAQSNSNPISCCGAPAGIQLLLGANQFSLVMGPLLATQGNIALGVAVNDLDHDGRPDLVAVNGSGELGVFRNQGGLSFAQPEFHAAGKPVRSVAAADFDGDAEIDVAVANDGVSVALGQRNTTHLRGAPLVDFYKATDFTVGDFDEDGAIDATIAQPTGGGLLRGIGDGSFRSAAPAALLAGTLLVRTIDSNLDGHLDLVAVRDGLADSLLGNGSGGFRPIGSVAYGGSPRDVEVLDADGDGRADAAVAHAVPVPRLALLRGTGTGLLQLAQQISLPATPVALAVGRVDADGLDDVVVALGTAGGGYALMAALGSPAGLSPLNAFAVATAVLDVALIDLNGDAAADLLSLDAVSLAVRLGNGVGGFLAPVTFPAAARRLAVGDLDGDGAADVALLGDAVAVRLGDGQGGLGAEQRHASGTIDAGGLADLDADGRLDVLVLGSKPLRSRLISLLGTPPTAGLAPFGVGTPGCLGSLGLSATSTARVGDQDFGLVSTNAPSLQPGFLLIGSAPSNSGYVVAGSLLHVLGPVLLLPSSSDASGVDRHDLPIPNDPGLANIMLYVQSVWFELATQRCSQAGVVSSKGLRVTIQP